MTMYRATGTQLTRLADTDLVRVAGLSLSVAAAARRFPPTALAQAALYLEYREPDLGDGWDAPRIGTGPDGTPCALLPAIVRTAADVADDARRLIVARAQGLQEQAAGAYGWPEASAWVSLREQARDWVERTGAIGEVLAAAVGVEQTLVGDERALVAGLAQQVENAAIDAAACAVEQGLPYPEYTPLQQESAAWLNTANQLGEDLAADCGPDAPVTEICVRVASILSKAALFRDTVGAVKRWRRQSLAAIDAGLQMGCTREDLQRIVEQALASVADGAPSPVSE